jgi:exodeoxyribonuclease VIII
MDILDSVVGGQVPEGDAPVGMCRDGEGAPALSPERVGVVHDLPFADYLATPSVSKSSLWTAHTKSPAHARVVKEESNAMALGTAVHCAILEPDAFTSAFTRGPEDRRGNRWKEAVDEHGDGLLTAGDYDAALAIRDALRSSEAIRRITGAGSMREVSGFWRDAETGLACRCRPDAYVRSIGLMADVKTTTDVREHQFRRRVEDFGYHAQEAFYTDGWRACGMEVEAFVFIAVETAPPYAHAIYELAPAAGEEGRAAMRAALDVWAQCTESGVWPAYPPGVRPLDISKFAYRLTDRPSV